MPAIAWLSWPWGLIGEDECNGRGIVQPAMARACGGFRPTGFFSFSLGASLPLLCIANPCPRAVRARCIQTAGDTHCWSWTARWSAVHLGRTADRSIVVGGNPGSQRCHCLSQVLTCGGNRGSCVRQQPPRCCGGSVEISTVSTRHWGPFSRSGGWVASSTISVASRRACGGDKGETPGSRLRAVCESCCQPLLGSHGQAVVMPGGRIKQASLGCKCLPVSPSVGVA